MNCILSLQDICVIHLAGLFWMRNDMTNFFMIQANGTIPLENGLHLIRNILFHLPLGSALKNKLMDTIERMGYQLYTFLQTTLINNASNILSATDIIWTYDGYINEEKTLENHVRKNPGNETLRFIYTCLICDDIKINEVWKNISNTNSLLSRHSRYNLVIEYWINKMANNLNKFSLTYGQNIVGFEPLRTVEFNMMKYCITLNLRKSFIYFYKELSTTEREFIIYSNNIKDIYYSVLKNLILQPKEEHYKYICSFLETPIVNINNFRLIATKMPNNSLEQFIYYLLRQINNFGDLHFNIFKHIIRITNNEVKSMLISKIDFLVLTLLGKGRFEMFESLLTEHAKTQLFEKITNRFIESKGLALFLTICKNNQKDLLLKCFKYLSKNETEELFFHKHLNSVLNGTQFDTVRKNEE